jgi:UDP-glucuronate decarboxylase
VAHLTEVIAEDIDRVLSKSCISNFDGKKVLVSGGSGFIGSYICESLVRAGALVTCLDNFATGRKEYLSNILYKDSFKLVNADVNNFETTEKYAFIFHLASRASPEEYQINPVDTLMANSIGSMKLLDLARKTDSKILFASTSEVYGDSQVIPTPESYWGNVNPIGPRSCYDEGKRYGEALFMAYFREFGTDNRIVRIHNTYGPRLRADGFYARAVSRFIFKALRGEEITIYGDGTQTRSFCYISDTVRALFEVMIRAQAKGEVINIGSSDETSILELAEKIITLTNSKSRIVFCPLPQDDPKRRCPDISKANRLLGWMPEVDLDSGLRRSIEWLKTFQFE